MESSHIKRETLMDRINVEAIKAMSSIVEEVYLDHC